MECSGEVGPKENHRFNISAVKSQSSGFVNGPHLSSCRRFNLITIYTIYIAQRDTSVTQLQCI